MIYILTFNHPKITGYLLHKKQIDYSQLQTIIQPECFMQGIEIFWQIEFHVHFKSFIIFV